jgi:hypothetical protein
VELAVTYTEPGVRGDTASGAVTKPAKLETGLEIRVPFFVKQGERSRSTPRRASCGPRIIKHPIECDPIAFRRCFERLPRAAASLYNKMAPARLSSDSLTSPIPL